MLLYYCPHRFTWPVGNTLIQENNGSTAKIVRTVRIVSHGPQAIYKLRKTMLLKCCPHRFTRPAGKG